MTGLHLWIQNPAYQETAFLLIFRFITDKTNIDMANIELPDFMSYKDKFSNSKFVEKIQRVAKRAGAKLVYVA